MAPQNAGRLAAMKRALSKRSSSLANDPGQEAHQTTAKFDREMDESAINDENH